MISILNELEAKYGLRTLIKKGLIPWTIARDRDIFNAYDIYIKMGESETDAKEKTAEDFKISSRTVYRIVKKLNEKDRHSPKGA